MFPGFFCHENTLKMNVMMYYVSFSWLRSEGFRDQKAQTIMKFAIESMPKVAGMISPAVAW